MVQKTFLFRVPGHAGLYDFTEIKHMPIKKTAIVIGIEITGENTSRKIGRMSLSTALAKFG